MPEYAIEHEVRFAVVLYGGVSLAIYINGVVQEMLRLVRSTSPAAGDLDPIEKVYRNLGRAIAPAVTPTQLPKDGDPVRTRFCIDVISGTSAGGINGIFLAKALANNAKLDELQKLWFNQGALEKLLNDEKSQNDLPFSARPGKRSLLNSGRMFYQLLQAFKGMDAVAPNPPRQPLADHISLFATTTDIAGVALPIQLWDEVVYERRYRNVFRLRYSPRNRFEKEGCNDFAEPYNPFLAFAARCTSSFPFAFEPMRLADIDDILKCDSVFKTRVDECGSGATRWQQFFRQYLNASANPKLQPGTGTGQPTKPAKDLFVNRAFGDGGYLNNKPFSYAIDALAECESDLPMERKLIYVEPSPEHPESQKQNVPPPNAIENSIDALVTIPGYQTIREDLARARERNAIISRINEAIEQIEDADNPLPPHPHSGAGHSIREFHCSSDPHLRQYYRLRATDVTNQLSDVIARAYAIEQGTAPYKCLRAVIHEWRVQVYENNPKKGICGFLQDFDLPYRLRRLRFLLRKLDILVASSGPGETAKAAARAVKFAGVSASEEGWPAELKGARPVLAKAYRMLADLRRSLLSDEIPLDGAVGQAGAPAKKDSSSLGIIRGVLGDREKVMAFLESLFRSEASSPPQPSAAGGPDRSTRKIQRRAGDSLDVDALLASRASQRLRAAAPENAVALSPGSATGATVMERLETLGEGLAKRLRDILADPDVQGAIDLLNQPRARILSKFFTDFDLFDFTVFPILYGTPAGDGVPVEILRLSPEDVYTLQPDAEARRTKLKGLAVAHFGAFLDETWRENDLLWGRLDAAERLIAALLPLESSETLRNQLIDEAQGAILADFEVQEKTRKMALARVAGKHPSVRFTAANANKVVDALATVKGPITREQNRAVMDNWCTLVPDEMDRKLLLKDLARGSQITGEILDGIGAGESVPVAGKWLTRAGRALWSMVELSVPRTAGTLIFRYWAQLLYLIAILLIFGGAVSAAAQLTQFGWTLLGIVFTAHMARMLLTSFMEGPNWLKAFLWTMAAILVAAAILLVVLGIGYTWALSDRVLDWAGHHPIPGIPMAYLTPALVNVAFAVIVPLLAVLISVMARLVRRVRRVIKGS